MKSIAKERKLNISTFTNVEKAYTEGVYSALQLIESSEELACLIKTMLQK